MTRVRLTQSLVRAARFQANETATIEGDRTLTWGQLRERVARLAGAFHALGVQEGDRVAVLANNCTEYLEAYNAVSWAGAVIVPFNTRLAEPELRFQMDDADVKLLLYGPEFAETATKLKEAARNRPICIAMLKLDEAADHSFDSLIASHDPAEESTRSGDDLAGIYFTGGTTGLPKGVMLSHENLHAMSRNLVIDLHIKPGCVNLHSAPMFHVSAVGIFFTTMLMGVHVFIPQLEAGKILEAIETYKVTHCFSVPAIIDRMTNDPTAATRDLSTLCLLGYGGSAMPVAAIEAARERFPNAGLAHGYGMTEMSATTALRPSDHVPGADPGRLRSVGRAMADYELKVVDDNGVEVETGTLGEIIGRGPNVMLGYWNRPEETAAALRDGWMHSQDVGYQDKDGYIYIVDRIKDMIVSGAENVYSIEVEDAIFRSGMVVECAVIGVPDEKWGERVHAVLVPHPGTTLDEQELLQFCRKHIAGYKCPKSFEIRTDPLPRSAAGKVLKNVLREEFANACGKGHD